MRLTRQTKQPGRLGLNMAAMIDVVFLLLIFFMCTSAAPEIENELPTRLPQSTGERAKTEEFDPIRIRLSRPAETLLLTCDDQPCVDAAGRASFGSLVLKLSQRRAVKPPAVVDVPVIIEGEAGVPFGKMIRALNSCYATDFRRVAFSAKGTEE